MILEQTSEYLRIGYRRRPWRRWAYVALSFAWLVSYIAITLYFYVSGHPLPLLCGTILIPSVLLVAYLGLVRVTEEWQFDLVSGNLTIVQRSLLLRSERLLRYPLTDIERVILVEPPGDGVEFGLCLRMRSGKMVEFDSYYGHFVNGPRIAQAISTFLGIPKDAKKGFLFS